MNDTTTDWYVLHVFSGYEQKIKKQIEKKINDDEVFKRVCHEVKIPEYEQSEMRDGKLKVSKHKLMPGYILVKLDLPKMNVIDTSDDDKKRKEDEYYEKYKQILGTFKSINGVMSFVGLTTDRNSQPKPLLQSEFNKILEQTGEKKVERTVHATYDFNPGDSVKIISGAFSGFNGIVKEVLPQRNALKVSVEIFGRPTLLEVDAMATEKK